MTEGVVAVTAGWAADGTIRSLMSPGLAAQVAASDAQDAAAAERREREHQAAWAARHEQAVDAATWQVARERGIPLAEARRSLGHTPREFVELCSAQADVEDARQEAERARLMRRHLIDAGLLDVSESEPSERAIEIGAERAVMTAPKGEPFDAQAVARGIRGRWLRKHYTVME
jgi:hypothetical protein